MSIQLLVMGASLWSLLPRILLCQSLQCDFIQTLSKRESKLLGNFSLLHIILMQIAMPRLGSSRQLCRLQWSSFK